MFASRISRPLAGCLLALGLSATAFATPVATVNGVAIPQERMLSVVKMLQQRGQADSPELRARIREKLIQDEIIRQAAQQRGLDRQADVLAALDEKRRELLINAYLEQLLKQQKVDETSLKQQLAQHDTRQIKLRVIEVRSAADAAKVLAQLRKGKRFDQLAREFSVHASRESGGLIESDPQGNEDWIPVNELPEQVATPLKSMKAGGFSQQPIKLSDESYLLLNVLAVKAGSAFDSNKPLPPQMVQQLTEQQQMQIIDAELQRMRKAATVR